MPGHFSAGPASALKKNSGIGALKQVVARKADALRA
jgi:hypothetical protein